jgi:hypothetical protein
MPSARLADHLCDLHRAPPSRRPRHSLSAPRDQKPDRLDSRLVLTSKRSGRRRGSVSPRTVASVKAHGIDSCFVLCSFDSARAFGRRWFEGTQLESGSRTNPRNLAVPITWLFERQTALSRPHNGKPLLTVASFVAARSGRAAARCAGISPPAKPWAPRALHGHKLVPQSHRAFEAPSLAGRGRVDQRTCPDPSMSASSGTSPSRS